MPSHGVNTTHVQPTALVCPVHRGEAPLAQSHLQNWRDTWSWSSTKKRSRRPVRSPRLQHALPQRLLTARSSATWQRGLLGESLKAPLQAA